MVRNTGISFLRNPFVKADFLLIITAEKGTGLMILVDFFRIDLQHA
jgi:hypothetical protein